MYIIAEGVETKEELEKVLELKVDLLQGYYLARPAAVPQEVNPDAVNYQRKKSGNLIFPIFFVYIFLPFFHIITIQINQ